jgi:hypothetical protein
MSVEWAVLKQWGAQQSPFYSGILRAQHVQRFVNYTAFDASRLWEERRHVKRDKSLSFTDLQPEKLKKKKGRGSDQGSI